MTFAPNGSAYLVPLKFIIPLIALLRVKSAVAKDSCTRLADPLREEAPVTSEPTSCYALPYRYR